MRQATVCITALLMVMLSAVPVLAAPTMSETIARNGYESIQQDPNLTDQEKIKDAVNRFFELITSSATNTTPSW